MKNYSLRYLGKDEVAANTYAFRLEKPHGFNFKAGQYMTVYLGKNSHDFSIASSPHEDSVMFATRIRPGSVFKKKLMELSEGDSITINGPSGSFSLPEKEQIPVALIAGGIGVTPFRSMIKHEERLESQRQITFLYTNRKPEDAAYLHELESISLRNYRCIPTMTDLKESASEWNGEMGYINSVMLNKYIDDFTNTRFYIVGPPAFVSSMNDLLLSLDSVPSTHIRAEDFAGY